MPIDVGPHGHMPVMLGRALEYLNVKPDGIYADCTLGAGGYTEAILANLVGGRVLAIDRDEDALQAAQARIVHRGQVVLKRGNFNEIARFCREARFPGLDGVVYDLGVSSMQLDRAERGFSFRLEGPLDMRMDRSEEETAREWLKRADEREFSRLLFQFGEKKYARKLARAICHDARQGLLQSAADLAGLVRRVRGERRGKTDSATRVFLAIRAALNRELESLSESLAAAIKLLKTGGRIVVVSYHSLEDRIAKELFAKCARGCRCELPADLCLCAGPAYLKTLTRRPILPSDEEIEINPRSRSAKLRAAERI